MAITDEAPPEPQADAPVSVDRLERRWLRWFDPLILCLLAILVSGFRSWSPSLWHDEAATISASTRAPEDMFRLLSNVDAVHGLYYFGMHLWLQVVPISEFWVRLPSVLVVGVAAAGVVVLGKLVSSRPVALVAAVVFLTLPRMTSAGIEARSYAFSAALAVWVTVVFVVAIRRRAATAWVLYAILLALATATFVYGGLLLVAHVVTLIASRRLWRSVPAFVVAGAAGAALAAPVALVAQSQSSQVSWISDLDQNLWQTVLVDQYFDGSLPAAVVAAVVLAAGIAARLARGRTIAGVDPPGLLGIAVPWLVLPVVLLLGYSLVAEDMFLGRYFTFTAPACALILAQCLFWIAAVFRTRPSVVLVLLLLVVAASALPRYLQQRQPYAKPSGMDYNQVADLIAADARAGDCVMYQLTNTWNPAPMRAVQVSDPSAFDGLRDVSLGLRAAEMGQLWDQTLPAQRLAPQLGSCGKVWLLTDGTGVVGGTFGPNVDPNEPLAKTDNYRALRSDGFHVQQRWRFNVSQVALFER